MKNLKEQLLQEGILLPDNFFKLADKYSDYLLEWNRVHNLTGAKNSGEIYANIYDSLYPISFLPPVKSALDIGTGAGFPGLILAMALPETHFTLAEPLNKRSSFLHFIKSTLKLDNATIKPKRVEQIEPFLVDLVTSRAVTKTQMLLDLSRPFISDGGLLLFYKGEQVINELPENREYNIIQNRKRNYLLIKS